MIESYFRQVTEKISEIRWMIRSERVNYKILSAEMGIIKGEIVFVNGSVLTFRERVSPGISKYRFYFMNANKDLIYRWDTAPHYREIRTFPYHLHHPDGVKESEPVNLIQVLESVARLVAKELRK